ncbi:hypothetical protein GCM10009347_40770 [Shewanella algicola]|uniref:Uncharacterized protein n=1 Tax=Shewanella algicola TaxID=640633 RepID=A0A9X1ZFB9_9GAMM|nr:hypothetical protein [Shewanella algicola]MCL1107675.1 hypothetical protein [Shewanella algicola]GGP71805.1 hypothetical protein GCM10009347_40770 [Shewanella algicola]
MSKITGASAAVTFENMDVFAERPWMGLLLVTEAIALRSLFQIHVIVTFVFAIHHLRQAISTNEVLVSNKLI